jgi:hypothetical protein
MRANVASWEKVLKRDGEILRSWPELPTLRMSVLLAFMKSVIPLKEITAGVCFAVTYRTHSAQHSKSRVRRAVRASEVTANAQQDITA